MITEGLLNTDHHRIANKITTKYHLTPVIMAIIKKIKDKCCRWYGVKGVFVCCL
jgi:hypothetical protein